MKNVEVVCYPQLWEGPKGSVQELLRDVVISEGAKEVKAEAKFILLKSADTLVVVIGALFQNRFYAHKHILNATGRDYANMEISGGGEVVFSGWQGIRNKNEIHWGTTFHGKSKEFGIFDTIMLDYDVRQKIAKILDSGSLVDFKWEGTQVDRQKND